MHGGGRGLSSSSFALAAASSLRRGFWLDRAAGWEEAAVSGAHRYEDGQVESGEAGRRVLTALKVSCPQSAPKGKVASTPTWSEWFHLGGVTTTTGSKLEEVSEGG